LGREEDVSRGRFTVQVDQVTGEICQERPQCSGASSDRSVSLPRGHREGHEKTISVPWVIHKRRRLKQSEQDRYFTRDLAQL